MSQPRRICLVLEYDGRAYHGWQRQANAVTIQEVVEGAILAVTKEKVPLLASGRTDAGVHALGQVAAFPTHSRLAPFELAKALNAALPGDIRVLSAVETSFDFHPQFDAVAKTYLYIILNRAVAPALLRGRCWHVSAPLDVAAMSRAASHLVGKHDFSTFRSSSCVADSPVRTLTLLELTGKRDLIEITCAGEGFLKNMVRNIVGTLVEVGRGERRAEDMPDLLAARDRTKAGRCAPPDGLYLVSVSYSQIP